MTKALGTNWMTVEQEQRIVEVVEKEQFQPKSFIRKRVTNSADAESRADQLEALSEIAASLIGVQVCLLAENVRPFGRSAAGCSAAGCSAAGFDSSSPMLLGFGASNWPDLHSPRLVDSLRSQTKGLMEVRNCLA